MKLAKVLGIGLVVAILALAVLVTASSVYGQPRRDAARGRAPVILGEPASEIGASVRDLEGSEAAEGGGVRVEDVRPGGPAEKAGLKRSDIVTKFDGENVRSARQFARVVRESPPGRTVTATVIRDGRRSELSITPTAQRGGDGLGIGRIEIEPWVHDRLGEIADRIPFELPGVPGMPPRARLGVSVQRLTPQLREFFGAKEGVLVSSVTDASPASRAGLKAGDVIASVNGQRVQSQGDLLRALRDAPPDGEITIEIVRDKKASSVKAKLGIVGSL